jgi:glucose/arabinose dehydrogenase
LYAIGLRNPWRINFDGNILYCADVGSALFEEINLIKPGGNYGWPFFEATVERSLSLPAGFASTPPLHA